MTVRTLRPVALRRSWLFLPGADEVALANGPGTGADVLIQELEDFTLPADRPRARRMSPDIIAGWKAAGAVATVRINPLDGDGEADLEAVMGGAPDAILLPKTNSATDIERLEERIEHFEILYGLDRGRTEIVPNIELARGLVETVSICRASNRIKAALVASEDMAADLGCERQPDLSELEYVRQRFLVDCRAAGVVSIDMPFTWADEAGARAHATSARALGYTAKSAVNGTHVRAINEELSPSEEAVGNAQSIIDAFEAARKRGEARVALDGRELELPHLRRAEAVLARDRRFDEFTA